MIWQNEAKISNAFNGQCVEDAHLIDREGPSTEIWQNAG